ncbi:hypothetical protein ACFY00_08230 [Kitasatospora sp. NPDC001540]|uniref:PD-(D/E)XK nuclease domain-containing protein n=1 Tax=Kitasatospora sp. NPDC001540 TaxID=3364014 RepID=UPI0036B4FBF3
MTLAEKHRREIESLLEEADGLTAVTSTWQLDPEPSAEELRNGQKAYYSWYARARKVVPPEDLSTFENKYEGGEVIKRIRDFLARPRELNQFHDPANHSPLMPKFSYPYETAFLRSLSEQKEILLRALYHTVDAGSELEELAAILSRIPRYLDTLRETSRANVPVPKISDEKDLQAVVLPILRLLYSDVREEDYAPHHAGGRSIPDFSIRDSGIIVETKMTRASMTDKSLGDELLEDWGRYPKHPDCRGILALIYDPTRKLRNPEGLVSDLSQDQNMPATRVIVIH